MHCHCGINNRAPRCTWTFTDPCKPDSPGALEESASPAWLAAPAINARDTTKMYIWRLDTGCGPTLYRKCHSHNTPGKRHNNTRVEPLAENCTTSSSRQREQVWQNVKYRRTDALSLWNINLYTHKSIIVAGGEIHWRWYTQWHCDDLFQSLTSWRSPARVLSFIQSRYAGDFIFLKENRKEIWRSRMTNTPKWQIMHSWNYKKTA